MTSQAIDWHKQVIMARWLQEKGVPELDFFDIQDMISNEEYKKEVCIRLKKRNLTDVLSEFVLEWMI